MDEDLPLNVKIKQEKLSPKRADPDPFDEIDKILDSKPFGEDNEKKNLEPAK